MKSRIEFNMHSNYSRMNGVNSAREIIDRAKELGMETIAITDIGSVKGLPEAYRHAKRQGIKFILGMEAFYRDGRIYCEAKNEDNYNRMVILVKNADGRKNLYKLISEYHKNGYAELKNREGLLIGLNSAVSDILRSLVFHQSDNKILEKIKPYDFILVDPQCYHKHNERLLSLADKADIIVIASNSPYCLDKNDTVAREALRYADNKDPEYAVDSVFYSTKDMLDAFDYLGEKAEEIVIDNCYKLAEMIGDDVPPIPRGVFYPNAKQAFKEVKDMAYSKAVEKYKISVAKYSCDFPGPVKTRLKTEIDFLEKNKEFALPFWIAMKLVNDSEEKGCPVVSRAYAGSSFIAYLLSITHTNPLPPHYRCSHRYKDECNYIEFVDGYESGFDLPAKKCRCGRDMRRDGHNIPYETIFGFDGDKEPNIDLNLCHSYYNDGVELIKDLFGSDNVIKGGCNSSVTYKSAMMLVKEHIESNYKEGSISEDERDAISERCAGAFIKTNVHPGKLLIIPDGMEIEDFTPIEYAEDFEGNRVAATHIHCFDLYANLFSVNLLRHDTADLLKKLKEKTGVEPAENDIADNAELLKAIKEGNTDSIPEMYSDYIRKMIEHIKPKKFSDCVAVSGLAHGTGVYEDNAKDLFAEGVCDFESVIAFREDILLYLDKKRKEYTEKTGKEAPLSYLDCYKISEITRKGRAERDLPEYEDALKDIGVPDWYIESMKKIRYLFTKAHSGEYMIASFKLLWYKLNYPNEFQEADYEVNGIVSTGFKKLDETLKGGFRKGDLCLIGARPGVGKTTFAVQLADFIADGYKKVDLFSLESPKKRLEEILYKQGTEPTLVEIDDTSAIDTDYIRNKLIETKADVAVIDYLGLFYASEKKNNRVAEASVIAYELRKIAEELNVAIVVTMQLSRDYGKQIHSLKHKCSLEGIGFGDRDANTILFLNRDNYYSSDKNSHSDSAQIIVAKNAYGNIGTVNATFDKVTMTFKEECEEKAT